jgi:beta-mannosidase
MAIDASARRVEFTFDVPSADGNPFAREVWATVMKPSGSLVRVPAFWIEGDRFGARIFGDEAGPYRLKTVEEEAGTDLVIHPIAGVDPGLVYLLSDLDLGFIRIDPDNPKSLATTDGVPYVPIGGNIPWAKSEDTVVEFYEDLIPAFGNRKLNWARIWMVDWSGLNLDWLDEDEPVQPIPGELELRVAENWDRIIELAEEHGVYVQMVLQHHGQYSTETNPRWHINPWNAANPHGFLSKPQDFFVSEKARALTKQKYRYIVARWGYSPAILAWELFNEVHWVDALRFDLNVDAVAAWHDEMAAFLRSVDTHRHLVTTSVHTIDTPINASMDFLQPHIYPIDLLSNIRYVDATYDRIEKPVFVGEYGDDHMPLGPEQKRAGVWAIPGVWAGIMGMLHLPPQPWLEVLTVRQNNLDGLGAAARFIEATEIATRDGLVPFSPPVESSETIPFPVTPGFVWMSRPELAVDIPVDGSSPISLALVPGVLANDEIGDRYGFASRVDFRVDFNEPKTVTVKLELGSRDSVGTRAEALVNDVVAASHTWSAQVEKDDEIRAAELTVELPAGPNTMSVQNATGPAWLRLIEVDAGLEVPKIAAAGRRSDDFVAIWAWNRQSVFSLDPAPPSDATIIVDDLAEGRWTIDWWDTSLGVPYQTESILHPGGEFRLDTPPIEKHTANGEWTLRFGRQQRPATEMTHPDIPDDWSRIKASVPGNVELDMIRAGLLSEELEKGHNIYNLRELEVNQWWYSKHFDLAEEDLAGQIALVLEGVDTLATVWLNGKRIGELSNMLIPHRLDVSDTLKVGRNDLVVGIDSTVLAARARPIEEGTWAMENNWESLTIRKAAHSFGWDIMPRVISAGLWRDVALERIPETRFTNVYLATTSVDPLNGTAHLVARWDIETGDWPIEKWSVRLAVSDPESREIVHETTSPVLSTHGFIQSELEGIDLWWPRGYGHAKLYDVSVELVDDRGDVNAEWSTLFGFRTVRLSLTDILDEQGAGDFTFIVNGDRIFIKGTNWVQLDAFHSRDRDRLDETLDLVADLNCNMIRCWGGNVYETSSFFERCDAEGIMVWQDFALACALYPQTAEFHQQMRMEAEAIVPMLRNHPSLAIWAGNNEIDAFYTFAKRHDPNVDDQISREVLASVVRRFDPWRDYLPSSPYISPELWSLGAPHERRPEDHLWGPRDDFKGPYYLSSNAHFVSEIGYHGCPARSSLERMMTPENLWPWQNNEEWLTHAVRPQPNGTAYNYRIRLMAHQISVLFGDVPDDLDDFIFASQVSQAEALKFFIERFRIGKGRGRSGILWWNIRDGWPQISDAVVDYYGERKLSYQVIRRVQQDVCVMLDEPKGGYQDLVAVNDSRSPVDMKATVLLEGQSLIQVEDSIPTEAGKVIGRVPESSVRGLYRIGWSVGSTDDQSGYPLTGLNHYLAGPRPFGVAECRGFYEEVGVLGPETVT